MLKEFATAHKRHDEVELVVRLEEIVEPEQEGVVNVLQDFELEVRCLDLFPLDDVVLPQPLHGVVLFIQLVLDQVYFSKGATTNDIDDLEVLQLWLLFVSDLLVISL